MSKSSVKDLFSFIESSPTAYHAVETMRQSLLFAGYLELYESREWEVVPGGRYFVTRNGAALIAFRIPKKSPAGFQIMASHDDSPLLKVKENPEMEAEGHYVKLNVERYGGMLCAPWFDRPLSCAGRLVLKTKDGIRTSLVDAKAPMLVIPNLAIHMNRQANDGMKYQIQKDLLPLYGDQQAKGGFLPQMAALAGAREEDILGHDLFVYPCMNGTVWGTNGEFMSCGRLDDLECAYASLQGFLQAKDGKNIPVHCVFDNEEVGSGSAQGAASTFLQDTLTRICEGLNISPAGYRRMLAGSFMLSADNAHAVHPNHPEKSCPTNRPFMNEGIVIKYSANQKYTTDGVAAGIFKEICKKAGVPFQVFVNHSDEAGGSTLGNLSIRQVAVRSVDIGLAQLAMHSPCETAGTKDLDSLIKAAKVFYGCSVEMEETGEYHLA